MYCNTVQVCKWFLEIPNMCKIAKQKCKIAKLLKILLYIIEIIFIFNKQKAMTGSDLLLNRFNLT